METNRDLSIDMPRIDERLLDRHYASQKEILREIRASHDFCRTDLLVCDKWLQVFESASVEDKYARNCLMLLMYSQLHEAKRLGRPFTDMRNCTLDLESVLNNYHGNMDDIPLHHEGDYITDLNDDSQLLRNQHYDDDGYELKTELSNATYTIARHSVITTSMKNKTIKTIPNQKDGQQFISTTTTMQRAIAGCEIHAEFMASSLAQNKKTDECMHNCHMVSVACCDEEPLKIDESTQCDDPLPTGSSENLQCLDMNLIEQRLEKLRIEMHGSTSPYSSQNSCGSKKEEDSRCADSSPATSKTMAANSHINNNDNDINYNSSSTTEEDIEYLEQINTLQCQLDQLPFNPQTEQQLNKLKHNIKLVLKNKHASQQANAAQQFKLQQLLTQKQETLQKLMQLIRVKQFVLDECQEKLQTTELVLNRFDEEFENIISNL